MPKYVQVVAHLNPDELEQQYRQAVDPVERSHFQIIWLLACGKRVREVAEVTGYSANWIRILVRRYNKEGPTALADQRQYNSGASPLLSGAHCQQLQRRWFKMPHAHTPDRAQTLPLLLDARRARKQGLNAIWQRQRTRLAEIVTYARANSPYYRELYQHLPERIKDPALLPVTSKKILMPPLRRMGD